MTLYWSQKKTIKQKLETRRRKGSENSEIRSSEPNGKTTAHRAQIEDYLKFSLDCLHNSIFDKNGLSKYF
jgi:hypothetical protein